MVIVGEGGSATPKRGLLTMCVWPPRSCDGAGAAGGAGAVITRAGAGTATRSLTAKPFDHLVDGRSHFDQPARHPLHERVATAREQVHPERQADKRAVAVALVLFGIELDTGRAIRQEPASDVRGQGRR